MGCYQCGSAHGSATILCPNCESKSSNNLLEANSSSSTSPMFSKESFGPEMFAVAATGVVILIIGYCLLFAGFGPQFGISKASKIQTLCIEKMATQDNQLMDNLYANLPNLETEFSSRKSNDEICSMLRDSCSNEPMGDVCRVATELMR